MAKYRARFNDKARAGGVAKRNQLKAKRQKQFHVNEDDGSDEKTLQLERMHENARPESDARKRVRMAIQYPEKANAAKKKRLDKYIDKQVRKEEKDDLLKKLAKTQKHVDTSALHSLGALGTGSKVSHSAEKPASFRDLDSVSESEEDNQPKTLADLDSESDHSISESDSEDQNNATPKSTFIDNRPKGVGLGQGGFGFSNLPAKNLAKPAKKPSWRDRLGIPAAQELLQEENSQSDSSDESDDSHENSEDAEEDDEDDDDDSSGDDDESDDDDDDDDDEVDDEDDSENEVPDENEDGEEDEHVSSGKSFMEWAKSVDPEASQPSLPTPKPQNYIHKHRKTEGEEAVEAVDTQSLTPGWLERMPLEPVLVERSEEIDGVRLNLPAVASEQQIMDAIHHHDVVVITGATGSGKTTQIPQFLFESGYGRHGMIGVTQPRRVAAVSMAQRIRQELCSQAQVGYQIRFDSRVSKDTNIKLMTDGVLLKEMSSDLLLSKYSSIVVDEAHERSVNTDILIGLLSRVVGLRRKRGEPLKLVVMSATLRVSDFAENGQLFINNPPIVNVESRQFPVTNHFSRRTSPDYVEEAIKKTKRIHEKLPKGGILIFLTGKDEIDRVVKELNPNYKPNQTRVTSQGTSLEEENVEFGGKNEDSDDRDDFESGEESDLEMDPEQDPDVNEVHDQTKLHVLPLYSLLSTEDQLRVFEPVPRGHRLCVVATNVAETSLTIPGIRYVVDSGRSKQRIYDMTTGIQKYSVKWISKASADQRSGRAGRTGPGHCYRLYSSAMFESDFPEFSDPEIVRMPIEGLVLQMKSMGIENVMNFPFPTQVPQASLDAGVKILKNLGALDTEAHITSLGEQMSVLPLHPRHAKMLLIGNQHDCLPFVVALVAALSVQDIFVGSTSTAPILDNQADVLQALSATAAFSWTPTRDLCDQMGLRHKAMSEVASLRIQLANLVAQALKSSAASTLTAQLTKPLAIPTAKQLSVLKQIVAAGYIDQIGARQAMFDTTVRTSKQVSRQPYITVQRGPIVYIHPHTVMQTAPDFVVYHSLTTNDESEKVRIRPLTAITEHQISALAARTPLVTYSKPLGGAYAPKLLDAKTREAWVIPRYGAAVGSGGTGWDLPPKKITQIRKGTQWIEK